MISGATRGAGGRALGAHLADAKSLNEETRPGASRGLVSDDSRSQLAELTDIASHASSRRPLYHMHADPAGTWTEDQWAAHWERTEREFGLERQPFSEAIHVKGSREHRHRVYSLVKDDGTCVRMDHDHARREKLSRIAEIETGEKLTPGAHNRAVLNALDSEGWADVAAAMREAGLDQVDRPRAPTTPQERAQAERTSVRKEDVQAAAFAAWRSSDSGPAFEAALAERGLRLAQGEKTIQLVDATGGTHDLRRSLAQAAKAEGGTSIRATDVAARTADLVLPTVASAREAVADKAPAPDVAPPPPAILGASEATPVPAVPVRVTAAAAPHADHKEKLGSTSQGGGVGTVHEPDLGDEVIDWSKPDAWERWVRQQEARARREKAKAAAAARAAAPQNHGGHDAKHAEHLAEIVREFFHRPEAADLDRGAHRDPALRDDGRHEDPRYPGDPGQPRDDADRLRGAPGRQDQRRPDGAAGASRAARGEGADAARPDRGAPRADRREPDPARAAAGHHRVQARRHERGLAIAVEARGDRLAELTDRLRHSQTVASLARDALDVADQRMHVILSSEPRPLDTCKLADELRNQVHKNARTRDQAAAAAAERLRKAEQRVGILDRIAGAVGVRMAAVRDVEAAQKAADRTDADRPDRCEVDDSLVRADRSARYAADERQRERESFEQRPDVQRARREAHGNILVRQAIASGDRQITTMAAHDLPQAREELLRREARERLRLEAEVHERTRQHQAWERKAGVPTPAIYSGPRMR